MAESISVSSIRFDRLNDVNYGTWEIMMEADLVRKGLWEVVEINEEDATKFAEKKVARSPVKMAQARAEMILNVEPSQLSHMRSKDPMDVWNSLKKVHRARGFATTLAMRRQFLTAKKNDEQSMQSWIGQIQTLAYIMEEADTSVTKHDKILALTMGLPKEYDPVIINFDATPNDQLTFDHVVTRLLNEETRQLSGSGSGTGDVAFLARITGRTKDLSKITCFNCKKKGHYRSDCPDLDAGSKKDTKPAETTAFADADDIW